MADLDYNMRRINEYEQFRDSDRDSDVFRMQEARTGLFKMFGINMSEPRALERLDFCIEEQKRLYAEREEPMSPEKREFLNRIRELEKLAGERRKAGLSTPINFGH